MAPPEHEPPGGAAGGPGPLAGIRVVEAGHFAAGPSCGAVLADWGADVVKVEPPWGDPSARVGRAGGDIHPRYEFHNRSKRSVAVDLREAEGRQFAQRLVARADVFVTNLRRQALVRFELDYEWLAPSSPRLVYAHLTAYGLGHPEENRPSWDHGAYWAMSGSAAAYADGDGVPPQAGGGVGDRVAGLSLAGAVAAALFERERTGNGQFVTASLINTGLFMMGSEASDALRGKGMIRHADRQSGNATVNSYRAADGRWFWLQLMDPGRGWTRLVDALSEPALDRFRTVDPNEVRARGPELVAILDAAFGRRPYAEWSLVLDRAAIAHAPVLGIEEAVRHPLAIASGSIVQATETDGSTFPMVDSPAHFATQPARRPRNAPQTGTATRRIAEELGYGAPEVEALMARGVLVQADGL